jgi:hypothetical protein
MTNSLLEVDRRNRTHSKQKKRKKQDQLLTDLIERTERLPYSLETVDPIPTLCWMIFVEQIVHPIMGVTRRGEAGMIR